MSDFVRPEPHRLTLSGGAYVDITKRLTHGETEDMFARISPDGAVLNRREVRTAKILAYLIGWSLTNDGTPVPYSLELPEQTRLDTIRNLDPDRAIEIYTAIEAHEAQMTQERAAKKKIRDGAPASAPTSPSPSGAAGLSPPSVN